LRLESLVCAEAHASARPNTQVLFPQVAKIQKFSNIFKRFVLLFQKFSNVFERFQTFHTPTCVFGRAFCLPSRPKPTILTRQQPAFSNSQPFYFQRCPICPPKA